MTRRVRRRKSSSSAVGREKETVTKTGNTSLVAEGGSLSSPSEHLLGLMLVAWLASSPAFSPGGLRAVVPRRSWGSSRVGLAVALDDAPTEPLTDTDAAEQPVPLDEQWAAAGVDTEVPEPPCGAHVLRVPCPRTLRLAHGSGPALGRQCHCRWSAGARDHTAVGGPGDPRPGWAWRP